MEQGCSVLLKSVREDAFQGQGIVGGRAPLTGLNYRAGAVMVPFAGCSPPWKGSPTRAAGRVAATYPLAALLLFAVLAVLAGATS